jgi:hypothetical protein
MQAVATIAPNMDSEQTDAKFRITPAGDDRCRAVCSLGC